MKKIIFNLTMLAFAVPSFAQGIPQDSLSYAAGIFVGENVKERAKPKKKSEKDFQ